MPEILDLLETPMYRLLIIPLASAIILTGIIKYSGPKHIGVRLIGAAVGIAFAWVAALTLGMPEFPPMRDDGAIIYIVAVALLVGVLMDIFLPPSQNSRDSRRLIETAIIILFGLSVIVWLRDDFDLTTAPLLIAWGLVALRLRLVALNPTVPTIMLIMMSVGLGLVAWVAGLPIQRDLAIGLASAIGGNLLWFWLMPQLPFAATITLVGGGALLFLSLRLLDETPALVVALILLGFTLFADNFLRRIPFHPAFKKRILFPIFQATLSLLPVGLAVIAAIIGVRIMGP